MINGILNVYKERGYTSHDVVARLRGIIGQKKIGHTGTLDPDAEGVLPVCLGRATKVCDLLTDRTKTYETVMILGIETDTQDMTGNVLEEKDTGCLTEEEVRECISGYVGRYDQIPPMYSALKVGGRKLCDIARAGGTVERKSRSVTIYSIKILEVSLPHVRMEVHCSKGTYIRTLCHDIGKDLKTGGCMEKLLRTEAAGFALKDSLRLSEIEQIVKSEKLSDILIPVDHIFKDFRSITLRGDEKVLGYNGNPFCGNHTVSDPDPADGESFRVYDDAGHFIAVYRYYRKEDKFRPEKMFLDPDELL